LIWGAWTAFLLILTLTHEPWRDELQAWGLVRASDTPFDVIANLRHEGHPPTWYFLLWPITLLTSSFLALQFVSFVVGCTAAWITLRHMPLSLWLRAAIVFSYYPLYEFGTISRSYSLTWLLTVLAVWLATRRGTSDWLIAVTLALLAGTTVLAIPLAVAIAIGVWGGPWFASRRHGALKPVWIAMFTAVPLAVAVVALPASSGGPKANLSRLSPESLWEASASALRAAFPVMRSDDGFWGRFVVIEWTTWGPLLGAAIIIGMGWSVRRSRTALTVWTVSTAGYLVVLTASNLSLQPRIVSPLWAGAIAAVWLAAADRQEESPAERRPMPLVTRLTITVVLVASLWASTWAAKVDITIPFSGAGVAADWIAAQAGDEEFVILCAINAPMCTSVSIRLGVPAYTSASGPPIEFVDWTPGWFRTPQAGDVPAIADALARRTGRKVFIVAPAAGYPAGCQNGGRPPKRFVTEFMVVCRSDQLARLPSG